jgi:hypothetical protein
MPKPPGRHARPPGGSAHRLPGAEGLLPRSSSHHRRLAVAPLGRAIRELRLPSPSSLAGLQGSPMWVLRVRSGRGPTLRTARRGTTSAWMGHATGPNCPGQRGASRIVERLSPCLRRRSPRKLPPGPVTQAWSRRWILTLPCATCGESIVARTPCKRRCFFGLDHFDVHDVWTLTHEKAEQVRCPSTECGVVNPHDARTHRAFLVTKPSW